MSDILVLKFLHIVLFAYWLGTDLGVYYSSYIVSDPERPREVRLTVAKLLLDLDLVPRICMTMMLPTGIHLLWRFGFLDFGALAMVAIWLLCFGWLGMVVALHGMTDGRSKTGLATFDFGFRLALTMILFGIVVYGALFDAALPYWAVAKIGLFAGMVACGLVIRVKLKRFGPAFARLAMGSAGDEDNVAIRTSLDGTRPFVIAIWTGILLSAALGLHLI